MQNSLINIFTGETIRVICWVLVHSLWQGLLLAVAAGIIMLSTKRSGAALRYNLLSVAMFVFITGIACTIFFLVNPGYSAGTLQISGPNSSPGAPDINFNLNERVNIIEKIASFLNANSAVLVLGWLLIITLKSVRMITGMYHIHMIRTRQLSGMESWWDSRVHELAEQLYIKRPVKFLQSGIAKIPMVIGHFKPIILFPVGLINSLSIPEAEAILLHELSHISRKDYLVNLIQNCVELFFFFNPALLWVSSLIKIERENCCDDIAVARTHDKNNYINALIYFQEYSLQTSRHSPALFGSRYQLFQRIKRIIYHNNKTLNTMEKTILAGCIIISAGAMSLFSRAAVDEKSTSWNNREMKHVIKEPIKPTSYTAIFIDTVPAKVKNDDLRDMQIKTMKKLEVAKKINDLKPLTLTKSEKRQLQKQTKALTTLRSKLALQEVNIVQLKNELIRHEEAIAQQNVIRATTADEARAFVKAQNVQATTIAKLRNEMQLQNVMHLQQKIASATQQNAATEIKNKMALQELASLKNDMMKQQSELIIAKSGLAKTIETAELKKVSMTDEIISDMLADGLIKKDTNLSFKLNNKDLIINGQKQPAAVHKKFKDKYVLREGWNLSYDNNTDN